MLFLHYDRETSKPLGIFTKDRNTVIPKPCIQITAMQKALLLQDPARFTIIDDNLVEKEDYKPEFSEESLALQKRKDAVEQFKTITVNGYEYRMDMPMQLNVALGFAALSGTNKKNIRLWCKKEDWIFKEHNIDELAAIAATFSAEREAASLNLHS